MEKTLEQYSYPYLLEQALAQVDGELDKRQGSILYDAIAPAVYELAGAYLELEDYYRNTFVATASGEYLDRRARECGLERRPAQRAICRAEFIDLQGEPARMEEGMRFALENTELTYIISKAPTEQEMQQAATEHILQCEQPGMAGNMETGRLLPITAAECLGGGQIVGIEVPGQDEESDEALRERMRQQWAEQPADGNKAQYIKWAMAYPGIGGAKIYPGSTPNTVDIYLIDTQGKPAGNELVNSFQQYIDPKLDGEPYGQGLGEGKAPLGAMVGVKSAQGAAIEISLTVVKAEPMSEAEELQWLQKLCEKGKDAAEKYFYSVAFKKNTVDYFALAAAVLAAIEMDGMEAFTLNGGTANISLQENQVPVLANILVSDGSKTQQLGGDMV